MSSEEVGLGREKVERRCWQQKLMILKEWQITGNRVQVAKKYGVHPRTLYRWKSAAKRNIDSSLPGDCIRRDEKTVEVFWGNELLCNLGISKDLFKVCKDGDMPICNSENRRQTVQTALDFVRLKYFSKGMNSGYTPDELVGLLGLVDSSKNHFERINDCIEFGIKKIGNLYQRKKNVSSLDEIMLGRDIALVHGYVKELREIGSKDKPSVSENIISPVDQTVRSEKENNTNIKSDAARKMDVGSGAREAGVIEFSLGNRLCGVSNDSDKSLKIKLLTKMLSLSSIAKKKTAVIIEEVRKVRVRDGGGIDGVKPRKEKGISLLKTTIVSLFTALIYFAVYMNLFHEPGFCRSIFASFWRAFPIVGH